MKLLPRGHDWAIKLMLRLWDREERPPVRKETFFPPSIPEQIKGEKKGGTARSSILEEGGVTLGKNHNIFFYTEEGCHSRLIAEGEEWGQGSRTDSYRRERKKGSQTTTT